MTLKKQPSKKKRKLVDIYNNVHEYTSRKSLKLDEVNKKTNTKIEILTLKRKRQEIQNNIEEYI